MMSSLLGIAAQCSSCAVVTAVATAAALNRRAGAFRCDVTEGRSSITFAKLQSAFRATVILLRQ